MALQTGKILSHRYRIVDLLGQGGFGAVYRAWDINLNRRCAVKENLDATPQARRQFNREASLLANLSHPNLPRVTDHFYLAEQGQYLVMDYVEGQDLSALLSAQGGPLEQSQVLVWAGQVCDALDYLHAQSPPIIHRDIKPANIKITPEGQAMLVDFGIAKVYDTHLLTTQGARAVTPGYSPLEQYGHGKTDARSDIYALGATVYNLLTGITPPESVQRDLGIRLPPPGAVNPFISPAVESAILKAMQRIPAQRFQSAAAFKNALAAPSQPPLVIQAAAPRARSVPAPQSNPHIDIPLHPTEQMPAPPGQRVIPWAWIGMGALVALVILGLIAVLGGGFLLMDGDKGFAQTQTALAILAVDKPTKTADVLPSHTPVHTPTSVQVDPTLVPSATAIPEATLPASPTSLQAIIVEPYCEMFDESPVYIQPNQPVTLKWRWDALTVQLVQDHIAAGLYEIYLDDRRIYAEQMSEIEYLSDKGYYRVSWYAPIGILSPGKHLAERYLSWSYKISDGWDTFGPGGNTQTEYDYCEIIVQ